MVSVQTVAVLLSSVAILLSLVSIRRQSIPSKYEAERRIREKFRNSNGKLTFTAFTATYDVISISVTRKEGLRHRIHELVYGDISGRTKILFESSEMLPASLEIEDLSTITTDNVTYLLRFEKETTDPGVLYERFSSATNSKLRYAIRRANSDDDS